MGLGGGAEGRTLKSIDPVYIYSVYHKPNTNKWSMKVISASVNIITI